MKLPERREGGVQKLTPLPSRGPVMQQAASTIAGVGRAVEGAVAKRKEERERDETALQITEADAQASVAHKNASEAMYNAEAIHAGELDIQGIEYDKDVYSDPSMVVPKYEFWGAFEEKMYDGLTEQGSNHIKDPQARQIWVLKRNQTRDKVVEGANKQADVIRRSTQIERRQDLQEQFEYAGDANGVNRLLSERRDAGEFDDVAEYEVEKERAARAIEKSKYDGIALNGTLEEREQAIDFLMDDEAYAENGGPWNEEDRDAAINDLEVTIEKDTTAVRNGTYADFNTLGDNYLETGDIKWKIQAEQLYESDKHLMTPSQQDNMKALLHNDFRPATSNPVYHQDLKNKLREDPVEFARTWNDTTKDPLDPNSPIVAGSRHAAKAELSLSDFAALEAQVVERNRLAETPLYTSIKDKDDMAAKAYEARTGRLYNDDATSTDASKREQVLRSDAIFDAAYGQKLREVDPKGTRDDKMLTKAELDDVYMRVTIANEQAGNTYSTGESWLDFDETADLTDIDAELMPIVLELYMRDNAGIPTDVALHEYWKNTLNGTSSYRVLADIRDNDDQ